ncbi:MAG: hypothetical protein AAF502_16540 [Bacteroidota bacterium]
MSKFEDIFKKKFESYTSMEGVDPDKIWNSVNLELDQKNENKKLWVFLRKFKSFVFLLVVGVAAYFIFNVNNASLNGAHEVLSETTSPTENIKSPDKITPVTDPETAIENTLAKENINNDLLFLSEYEKQHEEALKDEARLSENPILPRPGNQLTHVINDRLPRQISDPSNEIGMAESSFNALPFGEISNAPDELDVSLMDQHDFKGSEIVGALEDIPGEVPQVVLDSEIVGSKTILDTRSIPSFPQSLDLWYDLDAENMYKISIPVQETSGSKATIWPNEISFGIGSNLMLQRFKFKSENQAVFDQLKASTKIDLGYSGYLSGTWTLNNGLRFGTGIHYDNIKSRFDYSAQRDSMVEVSDAIVGFQDNGQGQMIPILGVVEQEAIVTRTVLHHNSYSMISLPLSVGYGQRFGRWHLGADLGFSVLFFVNQEGRSLNQAGMVQNFGDPLDRHIFPNVLGGIFINPHVGYAVFNRTEIRLNMALKQSFAFQSEFHGFGHSFSVANLNLGLVYNLKKK